MIELVLKLRHSLGINSVNLYLFRNQIANIFKLECYIARVCSDLAGSVFVQRLSVTVRVVSGKFYSILILPSFFLPFNFISFLNF